ncbi:MAG TPA: tRNA pseudouridine(55) synthase TruB [Kiritimatiellia bacterium]|nr:tRNA pseudouridine(55) synthase TruB [Kiritimatiellia bacterium]HMO97545.1 tRNA pseudouridine(55) synthase TruB [Kiritimatiellia bacterium]HMP97017.1 tRNA pseudouridine(55) synthase TruB [Kiritimatiellia bacterium]
MVNRGRSFSGPGPDPWDGVLLVDKPSGFTSHDVVAKVRGHFRIKKVGHGGTLDPMATGLLILLTGRGTRLSGQVMGADKTYEGVMRLGATTDTQDADGQVLEVRPAENVTTENIKAEMLKRIGDQMQTPPMVSAIKKNGVPLYKLARKGEVVEREPRFIHVYQFTLDERNGPDVRFTLRCTKGTYVRTLCADIGEALGCGAHLSALRRTASGSFSIAEALPLRDLLLLSPDDVLQRIIPMHRLAPGQG